MVCSLTLCFLATAATDVASASRRMATICSSLNRLFLMGSSLSKSHLPRNYRYEEAGQVIRAAGLRSTTPPRTPIDREHRTHRTHRRVTASVDASRLDLCGEYLISSRRPPGPRLTNEVPARVLAIRVCSMKAASMTACSSPSPHLVHSCRCRPGCRSGTSTTQVPCELLRNSSRPHIA